jgi:hypothetical protein
MKISDKYLRNLLREVVSHRAYGHCEFPGCSRSDCDPHHWKSKKNNAIKYDPDACINLCCEHHTSGVISAHGTPSNFKAIILCRVRTPSWADSVMRKARQAVKDDNAFREKEKARLLEELELLKCG